MFTLTGIERVKKAKFTKNYKEQEIVESYDILKCHCIQKKRRKRYVHKLWLYSIAEILTRLKCELKLDFNFTLICSSIVESLQNTPQKKMRRWMGEMIRIQCIVTILILMNIQDL